MKILTLGIVPVYSMKMVAVYLVKMMAVYSIIPDKGGNYVVPWETFVKLVRDVL
jgi:hypothetical protein